LSDRLAATGDRDEQLDRLEANHDWSEINE
jgi:hypothetical protein